MSYRDVYYSRINYLGETVAERIRNGGMRSFEKWKAESPHTIRDLSVERGLYFDGIILTNKDKENQKIMFLNVSNDIPLNIGDIMNWEQDDGSIEKWLLLQEEKKVNGTYRTFWIIRCNYLLKWIDNNGHLQESWGYVVSSLDSKIKGNFRTWNSLITPQPNKYAEIIMPRREINRATNFIIEQESWTVVEYDHTSVPGVIYLSLTEGKINSIYDNVEENIADLDKQAKYSLALPEQQQHVKVGEPFVPIFTFMKNGAPMPADTIYQYVSLTKDILRIENNQCIAKAEGEGIIGVYVEGAPSSQQTITVIIDNVENEELIYLEGKDSIRLDREETYILKGASDTANVDFELVGNDNNYARIIVVQNNTCIVRANAKNKLGDCILKATYKQQEYEQKIKIVPLWQVV